MKAFGFDSEKCWDYENGFFLTSQTSRIAKLIAHYEIYKMINEISGDIFEFGVFKGASFIRFATFRELFEKSLNRKLFGFDAFGEFPKNGNYEDVNYATHFENVSGTGICKSALEKFLELKGINNFTLVKGDILKTLPAFLEKNDLTQIALLHIDTDIYKPTKCILESCYHRVVKGGVIVLDDYQTVSGETKAVDEFFSDKEVQIKKFPFSKIPSYIIKQ